MTNKTTEKVEWPITTERYVAFIDIMGFKDMVARSTHDEIYQMMMTINESKSLNESVHWGGKENFDLVRTTTYSDSIMVYSKDNSYASLRSFSCAVSGLTHDLFIEKIP